MSNKPASGNRISNELNQGIVPIFVGKAEKVGVPTAGNTEEVSESFRILAKIKQRFPILDKMPDSKNLKFSKQEHFRTVIADMYAYMEAKDQLKRHDLKADQPALKPLPHHIAMQYVERTGAGQNAADPYFMKFQLCMFLSDVVWGKIDEKPTPEEIENAHNKIHVETLYSAIKEEIQKDLNQRAQSPQGPEPRT